MTHFVVDSDKAVQLLFSLLEEKSWLKDGGVWAHPQRPAHTECKALRFLMRLRGTRALGWEDCEPAVRKTVSTYLIDLLFKLRRGRGACAERWRISSDEEPWRQALEIVEHEIVRQHPEVLRPVAEDADQRYEA